MLIQKSKKFRELKEKSNKDNEDYNIEISLILPCYNEQDNVIELANLIDNSFKEKNITNYEILWIDDSSCDKTLQNLKIINQKNKKHRIISFRRRYGQSLGLSAGIANAKGEYIATLDADIQNDPKDIVKMLDLIKQEQDLDLIVGWRQKRWKGNLIRRIPSIIANFIIANSFSSLKIHDAGCPVKVGKNWVFKELHLYGELHRFISYIASEKGAKIKEISVSHQERKSGVSKYGISRTFKVILDIISLKFLLLTNITPIQVMGVISFIFLLLSFISILIDISMKFIFSIDMTGNPFLIISVFLAMLSIQFITIGLLGEMILRTYYESGNKQVYLIKEKI